MTTQCPICRSSVDVDDAKAVDGAKTQCPLCDEVFLVRPLAGNGASKPSSGSTNAGKTSTPSSGNASRRLLEEDVEGASPRVLVAHDSHAFGDVVRALLEEEGFDVEVVHDGDQAMKVIVDRPPLIAILEAGLPKKFGFQLCAEVRALPDAPAVRFLLVASIYDRKRFASQPTLANAPDDFVEPRNMELELLPTGRRLLRGRNDATASRPAASTPQTAARRVAEPAPVPPTTAPAVARPAEPNSVSRAAVGEDDFKDLFEDSAFQNTGSGEASPAAEAETPIALRDVDDLLNTGSGPALEEDDLLANMLEDSDSLETRREDPDDKSENTSEDPPEEKSSRESDDDELLRTLMQMASSEGLEPSKPTLEDDEVLPEGSEEVRAAARVEPDEDSLLGGILEDDDGDIADIAVPREAPRDEPTGRAPREGPMDLPSSGGSVPEVWRTDAEDAKLAAETDADELEKLLRGDSAAIPQPPRAAPDAKSDSRPKPAPVAPASSGRDDVIRMSEFEMDAPAPRPSNGGGSSAFELDGGDDLKAALEDAGDSRSPGGVMPASGSAGTPTVLKGPAAGKGIITGAIEDESDALIAVPGTGGGGGNSFSATESISGDDDEKSLAEAKVPMDDELDRLLSGGSSPRAPDNSATKPGLGPRPLPADDIAKGRAGVVVPAPNGANGEHEKARRLAKLIVGDILLYNADRIPDAVKSGTFFEVMKGDIKDGRDFYDEKVPADIRRERDYIQEVLEEVLQSKRKELGLS